MRLMPHISWQNQTFHYRVFFIRGETINESFRCYIITLISGQYSSSSSCLHSRSIFVWKEEIGIVSLIGEGQGPRCESLGLTSGDTLATSRRLTDQHPLQRRADILYSIFQYYSLPHHHLWNIIIIHIYSQTTLFFFYIYTIIGLTVSDLSYWTSLTMLVCHHHRAEHGAVPGGGSSGGVVMKQNASLINVSMWHYSGLYPPPFRIGFHTGRGRVVGISLNKHLSSVLPVCVSVWSVPWTNQFQLQGPHNGTCPSPQSPLPPTPPSGPGF